MPNSGSWMNTAKVTFGFIEIGAAIKFLWVPDLEWGIGILPRNVVLILFIIIGLALIAYLLDVVKIGSYNDRESSKFGLGRLIIMGVVLLSLYPIGMSLASPPTYHYSNMPRIVDEFIEAMCFCIQNPKKVDSIEDEAKKYALENFSKEHITNELKKIN